MTRDKEKLYEILKKVAVVVFKKIKSGEIKEPSFISLDIFLKPMIEICKEEVEIEDILNARKNIINIFDVKECFYVTRKDYLKVANYLIERVDDVEIVTSKYDEEQDKHNYSNLLLTSLILVIDSLINGYCIKISVKDLYREIFKKKGGI